MPLHNSGYQHWQGVHRDIWHRRAVIAANGLRGCLQNKWMRHLVVVCWVGAFLQVAVLFLIGQLLVEDSLMVRWINHFSPQLQTFARGLMAWLEQHPEISVRCTQNVLFYFFSTQLLSLSFVAIAMVIPHLISRDLSSRAILVYASKAVSRLDYLAGKWGAVMGLLFLTWLGPLLMVWLVGNLLAPRWHFFWHARVPLGHLLIYAGATMLCLSLLALGISALSPREKIPVSVWLVLWLVGGMFVELGRQTQPWLKYLSVSYNFDQWATAIFRLGNDLKLAQDNIPVLGQLLHGIHRHTLARWENPELIGATAALLLMMALAALVIARRVKPE